MKIRLFLFLFFLSSFFAQPIFVAAVTDTDANNNPVCWALETCENDWDNDGEKDGKFEVNYRSQEACGSALGFCYPLPEKYELSVSLPLGATPTTVVFGLGDYIDKMYKFLLAISMIFAVVMIMIGGLEYLLSSGGEGATKGRERINKAVAGLVLLFSATLILFTVNPQLLNLTAFSTPKIRTVLFIGDNMKCDFLLEKKYSLDVDRSTYPTATCGLVSKVVKSPDGQDLPPDKQFECLWTGCQGEDYTYSKGNVAFIVEKTCFPGAKVSGSVGGKAACISCEDITADEPYPTNIAPSATVCSMLKPEFHDANINPDWHTDCVFNRDLNFKPGNFLDIKLVGQCAVTNFQCTNGMTCSDYDKIIAWNDWNSQDLDAFEAPGFFYDYAYHKSICEGNPCEIAGGCKQDRSIKLEAAIAHASLVPLVGVLQAYAEAVTGSSLNGLSCKSAVEAPEEQPVWTHQDTGR